MRVCVTALLRAAFLINIYFISISSHTQAVTKTRANDKLPGGNETTDNKPTNDGISKYEFAAKSPPVLNTFENVSYWAETEETIFKFAKLRHQELHEEIKTLERALVQCKSSGWNFIQQSTRATKLVNKDLQLMLQLLKESINFVKFGSDINCILLQRTSDSNSCVSLDTPDWPNSSDLDFAMESLINVQQVYNYDYSKLSSLMSPETRKPPQLNAFHCAEIGIHALNIQKYAAAIEWLEFALAKVHADGESSITQTLVQSNLQLAVEIHNEMHAHTTTVESRVDENLFENIATINVFSAHKRKRRSILQFKGKGALEESRLLAEHNLNAVCSGQDLRTIQERSALYCWYDTTSSPARTILPYKKELLSFNPELIQAYDILGEELIASIIKSRDKCSWVAHKLLLGNLPEKLRRRTSSLWWSDGPELESLVRKMASVSLTDLSADGSYAPNNIVGYLFGRIHKVHLDTLLDKAEKSQNVFSTALISQLFYLNDVSAGGSTAFPIAGTAALPIKGSVVYWKNMYRNGSARIDTWHGSCPVIYGHKQALVVGLLPRPQFLTYPCTLNPNE